MRRLLPSLLALAACHSRSPSPPPDAARAVDAAPLAPPLASPAAGAPLAPAARLAALCARAGLTKSERLTRAESATPPPDVTERLSRAMRGLLAAKERPGDQEISEARRVRDGYLVAISVPGGDGARGAYDRWGFVPDHGAARRIDDTLLDAGDLDGDGVAEPVFARCAALPLYGQECKLTAWFPTKDVTWSGRLTGGMELAPRLLDGRRRLAILPADSMPGDAFAPADVTLLTFSVAGVEVTDGARLHDAEAPAAKRRSEHAVCELPFWWKADRVTKGLLALGATPAEAPAMATVLAKYAAENTDVRVELPAQSKPTPAAQAVWDARPLPVARCHELPAAERAARTAERTKAVADRAALRFAEVTKAVEVGFGCTSKGETPMLVTWAEATTSDHVWGAELYDLHGGAPTLLASTRSYWGSEWHIVHTLTLGPSADLDGDGEDETAVLGTRYEVGAMRASRVAALVRGDALVQAPASFSGPAFVAAIDPRRSVLVLPTPADDPEHGRMPWPPATFVLEGQKLVRRAPIWPAAVQAARAAHDAR